MVEGNIFDVEKRNLETNNNYGAAWANVSSTPFRLYKHYTHEGGSATPFIMHWPAGLDAKIAITAPARAENGTTARRNAA